MSGALRTVSVIMLTYNHEKYVAEAIESVLRQETGYSYELLIGDDCSEDRTVEIIQEYEKRCPDKIRFFPSRENQGTTKNAYRLFMQARGKYLASCEGDDYWSDPEKLQRQVRFLEENLQFIGCSHPVRCVDKEGNVLKRQRLSWVSPKTVYTIRDFKGIVLPGHSSSLIRRNIFLDTGRDYSIFWRASKFFGDRIGAVLWAAQGDFYRIDRVMSCYRCVRGAAEKNLTSIAFSAGGGESGRELQLTNTLEDYAKDAFGLNLDFDYYRRRILVSALVGSILRGDADGWAAAGNALADMNHPVLGLLSIPYVFLRKAAEKILVRAD